MLSTHNAANTSPVIPNINTINLLDCAAGNVPQRRPDDWKTVSQNLSKKDRKRVSNSLSINFPAEILFMPIFIGFLNCRPSDRR